MAENTKAGSAKRDFFAKVILTGKNVRLEPISSKHCETLAVAGADPAIWRYTATQHHEPGTMQAFIDAALAQYAERKAVPHAFIDIPSNAAVGSARFQYIEPAQRRLLIGGTWIGTAFQRSYINGEAKLLHLWYAFEVLGCRRVEFMTDAENAKSRASFVKLGATEEGILRKHMIHADGRNRDNAVFSIIDDEWPTVRKGLEARLGYEVTPSLTEVAD